MNHKQSKTIKSILVLFESNRGLLIWSGFTLLILWFLRLNYINWDTGALSNGLHGVKHWLDTDRYTGGAESILNGIPLVGRQIQFVGYMIVIAFTKMLGLPIESVVIIQIGTAVLAAFALFDATKTISGSAFAGFVASALFLANPFLVSWHMYVLTESLYTSFVIFSFWALVKLYHTRQLKNYFLALAILIPTMFIRPNGWILLPVFIGFFIVIMPVSKRIKIFSAIGVVVIFVLAMSFLPLFNKSIQITTPVDNLQKGITVWGHDELNVEMPHDSEIERDNWVGGLKYIIKHPIATLKLASLRVGYSLIHIRPYHSTKYKLRVLFWLIPSYILCLIAIWFYRKRRELLIPICIVLAHLFVIAVSYAEHDSRFDIYILPMIYSMAAWALYKIVSHVKNRLLNSF